MAIYLLLFCLGLFLLYIGAAWLVRGSSRLAKLLGVHPMIIGLTLVSFATSAPELVVSVVASLKEAKGLALGNIVGSNIANVGLILGLSGLVASLQIRLSFLRRELPIMVGVSLGFYLMALDLEVSFLEGLVLLVAFFLFLCFNVRVALKDSNNRKIFTGLTPPSRKEGALVKICLLIIAGGIVLLAGGELVTRAAVSLAREANISHIVIGLTLVAVGTSLPEMVTSLVAALRKESDICLGNLIGSNIFNILCVAGVAAVITPINLSRGFLTFQLPVMVLYAVSLIPLMKTGLVLSKLEAALLLGAYIAFLGFVL